METTVDKMKFHAVGITGVVESHEQISFVPDTIPESTSPS